MRSDDADATEGHLWIVNGSADMKYRDGNGTVQTVARSGGTSGVGGGAFLTATTGQTLTTVQTDTELAYQGNLYADSGYTTVNGGNLRLTAPTAGRYLVQVAFEISGTVNAAKVKLYRNRSGADTIQVMTRSTGGTSGFYAVLQAVVAANAGDLFLPKASISAEVAGNAVTNEYSAGFENGWASITRLS